MRHPWIILVVALLLSLSTRASWALDPRVSTGVSGKSGPAIVSAGSGFSTDDGHVRPGFPAKTTQGMIGVTPGGVTGSLNNATDDGFHSAGMGRVITAGVGYSTMDTVPGRTPVYSHIVVGTRVAPLLGGRGP